MGGGEGDAEDAGERRGREHAAGGAGVDDAAGGAQEGRVVGEAGGEGDVVHGDDDGEAGGGERSEQGEDAELVGGVLGGDGLVGEEALGGGARRGVAELGEGAGEGDPLAFAAAEVLDGSVGGVAQADGGEGGVWAGGVASGLGVVPGGGVVWGGGAVMVRWGGEAARGDDVGGGEPEGGGGLLRDVREAAGAVSVGPVGEGSAGEGDGARGGPEDAQHEAQESGLAAAVWADEGGEASGRGGPGDVVEDGGGAGVCEGEACEGDRHRRG